MAVLFLLRRIDKGRGTWKKELTWEKEDLTWDKRI
ncbi:hypothetical protein J2S05_001062 [Alkalicoccobacillus murimartini]|uniref:Uncharacterized protein n=1 Tax=Alkalicoccobacillus murimartini TaxID=171685 RepID=A0ABT9YEK8_9BACI|nr:hypothetical protein [Alkalicoccobacillus murimartini]